jgi:2-oxoglutarate ferredoxin oxidoreductase subunit alpha
MLNDESTRQGRGNAAPPTAPPTAVGSTPVKVKKHTSIDNVVIRFSGDSGDGMQLTGMEFTRATAQAGNDLQTFPDYPSEIRAPAGTIAGVSGFQVQFSSSAVFTSGDQPDVLVAMNPAALKANLKEVKPGGIIIVNAGAFSAQNLEKAGYKANPFEDGSLQGYQAHAIDITKLTHLALEATGMPKKEIDRAKNMYALGLMLWMYGRPMEPTLKYFQAKFAKKPEVAKGNELALKAGYAYGENAEIFATSYDVAPAKIEPGTYRSVSGNEACALALITASQLSGVPGFLGSYPITPATDILQELSKHKTFNFITFQAEDEIAGICSAIGAAYGGRFAATNTSGPGLALKQEAIGLAVIAELPLVIIDVQRGGPSTGLPTKTEQADLFQSVMGRNGECWLPVLAASSPADCFDTTLEASRIAMKYMTPVIVLSDTYAANGQEPWRVPSMEELPAMKMNFRTDPKGFTPYLRDENLSRPWVRPGTPGLEHRIGGLEKSFTTGAVSHDALNHEKMCRTRTDKVDGVAKDFGPLKVVGAEKGDVLVISWGSTYGAVAQAVAHHQKAGKSISHLQLRHIHPLHPNLGKVIAGFKKVVVPEVNQGQLLLLLRAKFLVDAKGINKVQGLPFKVSELITKLGEFF